MLTRDEMEERLVELVDCGRNIQAEVGGDRDYRIAAEKDANKAIKDLLDEIYQEAPDEVPGV